MAYAQAAGAVARPSGPLLIDLVRAKSQPLLAALVAIWIFSGGFVLAEPAPYELLFLAAVAVGLFAGFGLHRATLDLLLLFVLFVPFAFIGAFQGSAIPLTDALIFNVVTIFLVFTAYFVANYVADDPAARMQLIVRAYVAAALISAVVATLGYLDLIPGSEMFTRYGRAKGFFKDPNVFAPFLIPPALYALQRVLLGNRRQVIWGGIIFFAIFVGIFVSFSRAAWGIFAVGAVMVFALVFFLEANARQRLGMLIVAVTGVLVLGVALVGLLSIPAVSRLFEVRASGQSYDEGETGRFGRQGYAFDLALQHPFGMGPLEFGRTSTVREEPHNTYVTVLHHYGWGGGLVFYGLVLLALWRGVRCLLVASPNRLVLIPLVCSFLPLAVEAAIIDVDHWRHFFLLIGLIWGVTANYAHAPPGGPRKVLL